MNKIVLILNSYLDIFHDLKRINEFKYKELNCYYKFNNLYAFKKHFKLHYDVYFFFEVSTPVSNHNG